MAMREGALRSYPGRLLANSLLAAGEAMNTSFVPFGGGVRDFPGGLLANNQLAAGEGRRKSCAPPGGG